MTNNLEIAVFEGDGVGAEVMAPCLAIMDAALEKAEAPSLKYQHLAAGAAHYRDTGESLPKASMDAARNADAILLAAMGLPEIRYPDGTEISPQIKLRMELGLYAGVRPIRLIPGVPSPLADARARKTDFVIVRESTEGLFASHGKGGVINDQEARDTLVITRAVCEKLFDAAFGLARARAGAGGTMMVTCVDKANVFASFAFFRKIFDEVAARHPNMSADHMYVDAAALTMVRRPWDLGVLVTENMFGDILSDLGAGLAGGMGFAPSADIGDEHAVFQPAHGSAPDIAGQGAANPTAMILSGAMMLEWLSNKHGEPRLKTAADVIQGAVDEAFKGGDLMTCDLGGGAGAQAVADAILAAL